MSDDQDLNTGEARIGRFLLRLALAAAWAGVAWLVYVNAVQFSISPTMKYVISGFAAIMTLVSLLQAFGSQKPVLADKRGRRS